MTACLAHSLASTRCSELHQRQAAVHRPWHAFAQVERPLCANPGASPRPMKPPPTTAADLAPVCAIQSFTRRLQE